MNKKKTYEEVVEIFKDEGCELLSKEYINSTIKLRYKCICGEVLDTLLFNFIRGSRCKKCGYKKMGENQTLTFQYVKKYFKNYNCILLSTGYIDAYVKLDYICSCGNKSKITFNSFKNGHRCVKCGIEKNSGKNHYNYNSNLTDEDRKIRRNFAGYDKWRMQVFKKDDYICQKCDIKNHKLNARHIEGYAENKELRLVILNGITFCEGCHLEFHKKYGKKNNDSSQLNNFLDKSKDICIINDDRLIVSV